MSWNRNMGFEERGDTNEARPAIGVTDRIAEGKNLERRLPLRVLVDYCFLNTTILTIIYIATSSGTGFLSITSYIFNISV
jgi:hypothetical protein